MKERLRQVDANLLLSLHALLEERNLTHAGERMTMSQPAMSGALTRLRKHFDDELLVRVGRGFELTPFAERLRPQVDAAIEATEALLGNQREFDPSSSIRRFAVSMSEYAMTVLAEPLSRLLAEQARGCSVAMDAVVVAPVLFETRRTSSGSRSRTPRLRGRAGQPPARGRSAGPRRPAGDAARGRAVRGRR